VELREAFASNDDLRILWVMADNQVNDKTLRFIDGLGLRERIHFAVDPGSRAIDALRIRRENPEPIGRSSVGAEARTRRDALKESVAAPATRDRS
jgi:hypothetical protein